MSFHDDRRVIGMLVNETVDLMLVRDNSFDVRVSYGRRTTHVVFQVQSIFRSGFHRHHSEKSTFTKPYVLKKSFQRDISKAFSDNNRYSPSNVRKNAI